MHGSCPVTPVRTNLSIIQPHIVRLKFGRPRKPVDLAGFRLEKRKPALEGADKPAVIAFNEAKGSQAFR